MIYVGHLGSGLIRHATGPDALILICRPVSKMAEAGSARRPSECCQMLGMVETLEVEACTLSI